ncbi:MAG: 1-deoxy-D-xylulose-5-phosphate synthase [Clostridia bacterium]|nr:1-deoxy-D-xylulose-5-phosphate synthase [Clostridia bacterium]
MILEKIHASADLKTLTLQEMRTLSEEIRQELIHTVSRNGGHLASNLGVVELTLALHRVFDFPRDQIVFDVGHQSYVHKLITGRYGAFSTLRQHGGISGFPKRAESEYDCFETGHASTSISAALGMARARDYRGEDHQCIAFVGDGALTGGLCYEALNDAGNSGTRMIVILNDNEMSIAPNVGALSASLTNLRISSEWQNAKSAMHRFRRIPLVGKSVYRVAHATKTLMKTALVKADSIGFFETLGFEYFGPIDGHNLEGLEKTLRKAKNFEGPCVIHVKTKKGFGYDKAEERPEIFHGTPPFYVETGDRTELPDCPSSGHVMANTLMEMAEKDRRVVAITAAMPMGTGLDHFAEKFPDRMLDVGIAEEHAATMAAGLAVGGMRPYFAVYATFFQRCYDQMIHDVAMQKLPVVFLLDRSGIGGEDGQTHHGLFDFAETLPVPGMTVLAPCDARELRQMLKWTAGDHGPVAIRYARAGNDVPEKADTVFTPGKWDILRPGKDLALLAAGTMVRQALLVAKALQEDGLQAAVYNCSSIRPLDLRTLETLAGTPVFTLEEHMRTGGFGAYVEQTCMERGWTPPVECFAVGDTFLQHGRHTLLMRDAGLDAVTLRDRILRRLGGRREA